MPIVSCNYQRVKMNFYKSLSVTLFIQRFICVSPFRINEDSSVCYSKWHIVNGILQIGLIFVIYFTGINILIEENLFSLNNPLLTRQSRLSTVIGVFEMGVTYIVFITVIVTMYVRKKGQVDFLSNINSIDKIIQEELNISLDYKGPMRRRNIFLLFFFIYHFALEYGSQFFAYSFSINFHKFFIYFFYNYQVTVARFANFSFVIYANIVRKRFEILRHCVTKKSRDFNTEESLLLITDIFKKLQKSNEILNDIFGPVNLFTSTHDFTLTASQLFMVIWILSELDISIALFKVSLMFMWFGPNLLKLIIVSNIGHATANEMKRCKRLLFIDGMKNKDTMDIVENFSLRLQHFDDNYSASNFFPIDNTLLYTVSIGTK